jgi:hypothetical protein
MGIRGVVAKNYPISLLNVKPSGGFGAFQFAPWASWNFGDHTIVSNFNAMVCAGQPISQYDAHGQGRTTVGAVVLQRPDLSIGVPPKG